MTAYQKKVELASALYKGELTEEQVKKEVIKFRNETGEYLNYEEVKLYANYQVPFDIALEESFADENDEFFLPETDPYEFFGLK